jgi:hypothetical protein
MTSSNLHPVATPTSDNVAVQLIDAGYADLVSVIPPGASLSPNSRLRQNALGKIPGKEGPSGWHGYDFLRTPPPSRAEAASWFGNIGLRARSFPALDVDVHSEQLRDLVLNVASRCLGSAPQRVSRTPRALLVYRSDCPLPKASATITRDGESHLVEFLAESQQYVVHGTHPSGAKYDWIDGPLWKTSPASLSLVTAKNVSDFFDILAKELTAAGYTVRVKGHQRSATPTPRQEQLVAPSFERLREIVELTPNPADWGWHEYVMYGYAVKAAGAEFPNDARGLFLDWASRWELGCNVPETDERNWDSFKPPYRVGWDFLVDQAQDLAGYCNAQNEFDADAQAVAGSSHVPFKCNDKGVPYADQHNIRLALRTMGVELRYDLFQGRALIKGLDGYGPALDDAAVTHLYLEVDRLYHFRPGKEFFWDVVTDGARSHAFHPVREYLAHQEALWDGQSRIDDWLIEYAGAADTPFVRAVGRIVLVAAVRRVRDPGCKFDEMLVLEDVRQGSEKSTALSILAVQPDWFSDDLPLNADTKRVIESLSGRWIVEAGELKGMRHGEVEHLKALLSRQVDRSRMAYGRLVQEVPRQCVIIGTTNSSVYLKDTTGNRRFWPVEVNGIDTPALRRDRDQIWGEAAALEAAGESIRLPQELWLAAAQEQEQRLVEEPFVETLRDVLGDVKGKIRSSDLARILRIPAAGRTQVLNERLGAAARSLGFTRKKVTSREWGYVRGPADQAQWIDVNALLAAHDFGPCTAELELAS